VNQEKTKYMLMSGSQKIRQKHSIEIANRYFEDVEKFKYLGKTLTDQNCMHEEINSGLNSGNACCHNHQILFISIKEHSMHVLSQLFHKLILLRAFSTDYRK
jgi:hypothetical protein